MSKLYLLFLNTWTHSRRQTIEHYLEGHKNTLHIAGFSEVMHTPIADSEDSCQQGDWLRHVNSMTLIDDQFGESYSTWYMPNSTHRKETCEVTGKIYCNTSFGNMLLVRNDISVVEAGSREIFPEAKNQEGQIISPRSAQYVVFLHQEVVYLVLHYHGLWIKGNTKGDAPERTVQSARMLMALQELQSKYSVDKIIFGGDFNLDIDAHALQMLEGGRPGLHEGTYRNLIKECRITDTRTNLYREHGKPGKSMYADYVFVSPNVKVHQCVAPNIPVSDHRPIELVVE